MRRYMRRKGAELLASQKAFIRWQLPYGCYHCANGREVLYDRDYVPICERSPGTSSQMADPREWITGIARQEWFYDDATPEAKRMKIAEAKLVEWNMLAPVMAEIGEAIRNSQYFSWAHREWRQSSSIRKKIATSPRSRDPRCRSHSPVVLAGFHVSPGSRR
jgi:hypothetical protein